MHAEHAGLHVRQPRAAERATEQPPRLRQEVVVGVGDGGLLAEQAVDGEARGEHRHVEGSAVVGHEPLGAAARSAASARSRAGSYG